jgi:hypothetical protein
LPRDQDLDDAAVEAAVDVAQGVDFGGRGRGGVVVRVNNGAALPNEGGVGAGIGKVVGRILDKVAVRIAVEA